jgi:two-component system response regulator PilR (NtrC family)
MARILIVDDEASLLEFLALLLREEGYEVTTALGGAAARQALAEESPELVLCDVLMPDVDGLTLLREVKRQDPGIAVVMMTAYSSAKTAIEAMKLGAADYISKPFDVEELKVIVDKALATSRLAHENVYLRRELEQKHSFANILGKSQPMQVIFALIERIAKTNSTVLVQGESGTGKELIARAIHYSSPRAGARFLTINCGAMPENLLESELFGHERGAFTGAVREKKGLFQEAHRGTLFLDEIGEMNTTMQVKLLRALQERTVRKVGGNREEAVDVRIIAATNQDLSERIAKGAFREDLYYRINVIPIHLPPLRARREDIPLLVEHFIDKYGQALGVGKKQVSAAAMRLLEAYDWPGNVRELENLVERALALSTGSQITPDDLPHQLRTRANVVAQTVTLPPDGMDLEAYLETLRAQLMSQALERTGGVQTQAAELLKMTFRSFRYYARKAGLTRGREGDEDEETTELDLLGRDEPPAVTG